MHLGQRSVLLLCTILMLLTPALSRAADLELERSLRQNLHKSRLLLSRVEQAMLAGGSPASPLAELRELGASIRTDHQALLARLDARGDQLQGLGTNGALRHAAVRENYERSLSRYLAALAALDEQPATLAAVRELQVILAEILPARKLQIHGSVPYRHLNLPARAPMSEPAIVPAYRGGSADFGGADLAASPEAPISLSIAELAESMAWNPVLIYEWVKNNIQTEWYWGAMKGAEATLRQGSGNDADQAALLISLFRSAGFPARYVRGVIEFTDLESARMQTGLQDPATIGRLLQRAGIPYAPVISGGRISNFQIEHIWVEVDIPYDNYRGVMLDGHGPAWLALDTSIKVAGFSGNDPDDTVQTLNLTAIRDGYLATPRTETPLHYLAGQLTDQLAQTDLGLAYEGLLRTRTLNPEQMRIIPAGLQFREVAVTGEYIGLPAELLHRARFVARTRDNTTFFDGILPVYRLASQRIAVRYEPETIEDQEIMNAYSGLDNTPSYLIRLRPVLTVNGKRELVGQGGLAAGSEFSLTVELIAPGATVQVENTLVAGYPTLLGLAAQRTAPLTPTPLAQQNAERLLFERAMSYLDQGNQAEEELASLLQLQIARPLPTLATLGGVLDVVSLLDAPHGFSWQGLYLDADLRVAEPLGGIAPAGTSPASLFMQLAGLQNSHLEHRVFEEGFGVESVSTAKAFALALEHNIPLTQIDAINIATALPTLALPATIAADITNSVHQGYQVTIPESELSHEDWIGYAYLKENPATSESGWMLAGEIAGGMTALNPSLWPEEYYDILTHPNTESSGDPASAVELRVIKGLDTLTGTAGKQLATPLQIIALDAAGTPVRGVEVRFAVKAGGARVSRRYFASWQQDLLVKTNYDGIASVDVLFNQSTDINPTTARRSMDKDSQRVDETVIEVTTTSGLRTATPVSVFGFPDIPHHLRVTGGDTSGPILTWAATLIASVEDQYNNPHSGEQVEFVMGEERSGSECGSETSTRPGLLIGAEDPCVANIPVYGQCGSGSVTAMTGLYLGAAAHVLLGDRPGAGYPVTVKSGALSEQVTVTSSPAGPCDPEDPPYSALILRVIHDTDAQGNIITAGPVSTPEKTTTVPLLARLYAIREQGEQVSKEIPCLPSGSDTCPVWQGTGVYEIATDFVSASVTFDGIAAEPLGDGLYRVNYPLAPTPKKHEINVTGAATDKEKINVHICDERNGGCQLIEVDKPLDPESHATTVYAVGVTVPREQHIIPVNEDGYVTADYPISYTIEPPEYIAATADVVLSEKNDDGTFEEIVYFTTETSGQGGMTFLTGFRCDQTKEYQAQVLLNEGSDAMEIRSKEMTIQPLTLELDADLNRDEAWKEDDPAEHTGLGLIVQVNNDDDDGDNILDWLDGFDADEQPGNSDDAMLDQEDKQVEDSELVAVKFYGLPAGINSGTISLEIESAVPRIKIWRDKHKGIDVNGASNLLLDPASNSRKSWILGADIAGLSELPETLYIEGLMQSTEAGDVKLIARYKPDDGPEVETDRIAITAVNVEMKVDENRNNTIEFYSDGDIAPVDMKYTFWVNDDFDQEHIEEFELHEDDVIGIVTEQDQDWNDDYIGNSTIPFRNTSKRDLEDFAMLQLMVSDVLVQEKNFEYTFTFNKVIQDEGSEPAINLFEGVATDTKFLFNTSTANDQMGKKKLLVVRSESEGALTTEFINSDGEVTPFIFEGASKGTGDLTLQVKQDGNIIAESSIRLELHNIRWFYDKFKTYPIGTSWSTTVSYDSSNSRSAEYQPATDEYLLFVHGWNVPEEERERWAETVFKRLWWLGYKGGVGLFSWPCRVWSDWAIEKILDPQNFNDSEYIAWQSSDALKDVLLGLKNKGKKLGVLAHSQGNVVVGEAVRNHAGSDIIDTYIATQAAISANYYDINSFDEAEIALASILDINVAELGPKYVGIEWLINSIKFRISTPNIYANFTSDTVNSPGYPYFADNISNIDNIYNLFNKYDYALSFYRWPLNNVWRPAGSPEARGYTFGYIGQKERYQESAGDKFYFEPSGVEKKLSVSSETDGDRYKIFSYIAESRVKAMGTQSILPMKNHDLHKLNFDYKHYSHSRQFRSNIVSESPYWEKILGICRFYQIK
ncbi:MAG: transglutaminase domain-containing protein [Desulfobulbaceae bacterium]